MPVCLSVVRIISAVIFLDNVKKDKFKNICLINLLIPSKVSDPIKKFAHFKCLLNVLFLDEQGNHSKYGI